MLLVIGVGRTPYAALANSWGGDLVTQAGGRLLTAGLKASSGFARISNETVVDRDPDVIIAIPHGSPADLAKIGDYLRTNPAWAQDARRARVTSTWPTTTRCSRHGPTSPPRSARSARSTCTTDARDPAADPGPRGLGDGPLVAAVASLALGAVHIPVGDVLGALTGGGPRGATHEIVVGLRLPRTVDAILVGAGLGVAGALLQGALGNPLASPDVIGVTGGAGSAPC